MKNELIVYSKKVAEALISQGFSLKRVEPNAKHPNFLVFIFDKSEAIEKSFTQLTKK